VLPKRPCKRTTEETRLPLPPPAAVATPVDDGARSARAEAIGHSSEGMSTDDLPEYPAAPRGFESIVRTRRLTGSAVSESKSAQLSEQLRSA